MRLYLEYDASILFLLFFSCFFFVLTQKPTIHTLLALKNCIIPALGQKRKKISSDAFISRIRCLYFFLLFFSCFFFRFDPKTDHSNFTCLKKLYCSCSGSKTKKNQLWCLYISNTMPLFCSCSSLVVFFFVLTQKPTIHTLLALKICIILALGQKRKKNQLWCLYISNTMPLFFSCSSLVMPLFSNTMLICFFSFIGVFVFWSLAANWVLTDPDFLWAFRLRWGGFGVSRLF